MTDIEVGWSIAPSTICREVIDERWKQLRLRGAEKLKDGTGFHCYAREAHEYHEINETSPAWATVLLEAVYTALAEQDQRLFRAGLVRAAERIVACVQDLDTR